METTKIITEILRTAEKYKGCYFWSNTGNAASRRQQEFDRHYEFVVGKDKFEVRQTLDISCRNFYFSTEVLRNGAKTNITPLKTALKKLAAPQTA